MEPAVTTLLIGHRGVGKTSLVKRLGGLDLDAEIVKTEGRSIHDLLTSGERRFREIEERVLRNLVRQTDRGEWIAVGAGFEGPIPDGARALWVRRATDGAGRVFLDRPRLDRGRSPHAEYMERFAKRERRYREWAREELFLPEGEGVNGLESILRGEVNLQSRADLTLLPADFRDWRTFWRRRETWSLRRVEVRDDLLEEGQINEALDSIPDRQLIYSSRKSARLPRLESGVWVDWPVEHGRECPRVAEVVSLHVRLTGETVEQAGRRLMCKGRDAQVLKLAVEVRNFSELAEGHRWWRESPDRRAFLPRSSGGRWRWYRSLFGPRMPLHYIREGDGSAADQPLLWQALLQPECRHGFAAVLGHPVEHSWSPAEHFSFFARLGVPYVAADVEAHEADEALPVLTALGLRFASVTSPLKERLFSHCDPLYLSPEARDLGSVNTIYLDGGGRIHADNTDVLALARLHEELKDFTTAWLWGGGGIKSSVRKVWPDAIEVSARLGVPCKTRGASGTRTPGEGNIAAPDLLIWAVGRAREFVWPPADRVRPRLVFDLNYGADSPGLEWAVTNGFPYQSGERMFKLQAEAQRGFWNRYSQG